MNVNLGTFFLQCAAMAVWIFVCAGLYSIVERVLDKHYPNFLRVDDKDEQEAPAAPVAGTDAAKQA